MTENYGTVFHQSPRHNAQRGIGDLHPPLKAGNATKLILLCLCDKQTLKHIEEGNIILK